MGGGPRATGLGSLLPAGSRSVLFPAGSLGPGLQMASSLGASVCLDNDASCQLISDEVKSAPHSLGPRAAEDFLFGE